MFEFHHGYSIFSFHLLYCHLQFILHSKGWFAHVMQAQETYVLTGVMQA